MPNYRRAVVSGGTWFFTVCLADRRSRLLVDRIEDVRDAYAETQRRFPFRTDAIVVHPNHLHAIWTLPNGDARFPLRWRRFKDLVSKRVPAAAIRIVQRRRPGEKGLWQRRYWEHLIRDQRDYEAHLRWCYVNPVTHGLVERVADWPHSSFHRDVDRGLFQPDWIGDQIASAGDARAFGEPTGNGRTRRRSAAAIRNP